MHASSSFHVLPSCDEPSLSAAPSGSSTGWSTSKHCRTVRCGAGAEEVGAGTAAVWGERLCTAGRRPLGMKTGPGPEGSLGLVRVVVVSEDDQHVDLKVVRRKRVPRRGMRASMNVFLLFFSLVPSWLVVPSSASMGSFSTSPTLLVAIGDIVVVVEVEGFRLSRSGFKGGVDIPGLLLVSATTTTEKNLKNICSTDELTTKLSRRKDFHNRTGEAARARSSHSPASQTYTHMHNRRGCSTQ